VGQTVAKALAENGAALGICARTQSFIAATFDAVSTIPGATAFTRIGSRAFLARSLVSREEASLSLDSLLLRPGQIRLALSSEHVTVKISYPLSPTGSHVEVSNGCLHARSDTFPVELRI
jgi:hypothetical protein